MALLTCIECGRSVSDQAPACPGCGMPASRQVPIAPFAGASTPLLNQPVSHVAGYAVGKAARASQTTVLVWAGIITICVIIVSALVVSSSREKERAREAAAAQAAEEARLAKEQAEKDEQAAAVAKQRHEAELKAMTAKSHTMTRATRDTWLRQCVNAKCSQDKVDAIAFGAPTEVEQDRAIRVSQAEEARKLAREQGKDGTELSLAPIKAIIGMVSESTGGLATLELVTGRTTIPEAMKDSSAARGSVLRAAGNVVEIHADGDITEGTIATGDMHFIRFVTRSSTKGIYADSWASFVGVYIQEYAFANVSGGQTRSLLLAGAFDIPDNHKVRNGPEPPVASAPPASGAPAAPTIIRAPSNSRECDNPFFTDAEGRRLAKPQCFGH